MSSREPWLDGGFAVGVTHHRDGVEIWHTSMWPGWCLDCEAARDRPPVPAWHVIPALARVFWKRIVLVAILTALVVLASVVLGGEGSASLGTAVVEEHWGGKRVDYPSEAGRMHGTDSSIIMGGPLAADRPASGAIRLSHGDPLTMRSLYEIPVRPEPTPVPVFRWNCDQLAAALRAAGIAPDAARTGAAIAMAESDGRSDATNVTHLERSVGPFQVNTLVHRSWSDECLRSLACAAAVVTRLSSGGTNWNPWSVYKSGSYEGRC